jgi:RHS repeat-associated protein
MLQASRKGPIQLLPTPDYKAMISSKTGYDIDNDPVWQYQAQPQPIERIAYYQCDHLGTPQELTDEQGDIAWAAHYKAWGEAHEALSTAGKRAGLKQPIRFQGQYFDHETGLHYNRHRYYDPHCGRFISNDPIGLSGGINLQGYAKNPVQWVDPLGLNPYVDENGEFYSSSTVFNNLGEGMIREIRDFFSPIKNNCQVKASFAAAAGIGAVEEVTVNFKGELSSYTGTATGLIFEGSGSASCTLFGNDPEGLTNQLQIQIGPFGGSCAHSKNGLTCDVSVGSPGLGASHSVGYTTQKYKLVK